MPGSILLKKDQEKNRILTYFLDLQNRLSAVDICPNFACMKEYISF